MPSMAARRVLGFNVTTPVLLQIVGLSAAFGTLLSVVFSFLQPETVPEMFAVFFENPLIFFMAQFFNTIITTLLVYHIGRAFGGTGEFNNSLALMTTISVVENVLQLGQHVLLLILTPVGTILSLFSIFWMFWAMTAFIKELHGFESQRKVFGGMVLTILGLAVLVVVLSIGLGIAPQGPV